MTLGYVRVWAAAWSGVHSVESQQTLVTPEATGTSIRGHTVICVVKHEVKVHAQEYLMDLLALTPYISSLFNTTVARRGMCAGGNEAR